MTERTDERLQTLFTRVFMMILIRYHHEYIMGGGRAQQDRNYGLGDKGDGGKVEGEGNRGAKWEDGGRSRCVGSLL